MPAMIPRSGSASPQGTCTRARVHRGVVDEGLAGRVSPLLLAPALGRSRAWSARGARPAPRSCAVLGIRLIHSRPYPPKPRDVKQERLNRYIRQRFIAEATGSRPSRPSTTASWSGPSRCATYANTRTRAETGETPIVRFLGRRTAPGRRSRGGGRRLPVVGSSPGRQDLLARRPAVPGRPGAGRVPSSAATTPRTCPCSPCSSRAARPGWARRWSSAPTCTPPSPRPGVCVLTPGPGLLAAS